MAEQTNILPVAQYSTTKVAAKTADSRLASLHAQYRDLSVEFVALTAAGNLEQAAIVDAEIAKVRKKLAKSGTCRRWLS